jgi:hypothetical protein
MKFLYNAPWHPLKAVCLGNTYGESFFRDVRNTQVREMLQKIARETLEDFDNIEHTLKSFGIDVVRPQIDSNDTIMNYVDCNSKLTFESTGTYSLIPKPPMQPRDCQLIVGDTFWSTNKDIDLYTHTGIDIFPSCDSTSQTQFDAPLVTVIGNHIVVDQRDHPGLAQLVGSRFPERKIVPVDIGGHNDAVFAPVKPGLLISSHYKNCYQDSFPGWEVYHIPTQSWNAMTDWRKNKHTNQHKWWVPDNDNNADFSSFVDTWISHWLGYAAETVFDVNMLVVDHKHVLVNNHHTGLFECLQKHGLTPIITPFRHRFFWDGGIHCITSDLYREGDAETYIK